VIAMNPPDPSWETAYAHDRRAHRQRCLKCKRILNAGEPVIQAQRCGETGVRSIHAEPCADAPFPPLGDEAHLWPTWRDAMRLWGTERLLTIGHEPKHFPHADLVALRRARP
jgi:hypothetical protein